MVNMVFLPDSAERSLKSVSRENGFDIRAVAPSLEFDDPSEISGQRTPLAR